MQQFDIIIAGGGLAGLTLAVGLGSRPFFRRYKVLLIDREEKVHNDRTWSFWATDAEHLPPVVHRSWASCRFLGSRVGGSLDMGNYRYHMVRGLDFYRWAGDCLQGAAHITRLRATITSLEAHTGRVSTDAGDFMGTWVFNSALLPTRLQPETPLFRSSHASGSGAPGRHLRLVQHFRGWEVETDQPVFRDSEATLMDFRVPQAGDTRFVYVLPFSANRALVEYTAFSTDLYPSEVYDQELSDYLRRDLGTVPYRILATEFGVIPMTDYPLRPRGRGRLIHIGTAGGFVKGSSGYAFKRTQRKIRQLLDGWEEEGVPKPDRMESPRRFRVYDSVLLRVLGDGLYPGKEVFSDLFRDQPASLIFRFLDEDTSWGEDIRVMGTPPSLPFLRAVGRQLPKWIGL